MPLKKNKKVFVGMSGGVDSSVTAYLLKKQGYDVVGVFMQCFNLDGCSEQDALDARRVAEHLDIPFYTYDFEEDYKKRVVEYMIRGYEAGMTPNPDVMCNREIKFGLFLERALKMGADFVATGHYVKKLTNDDQGQVMLYEAKDKNKDQSYFLWTLTQEQLKYCLFPIGDYLKPEVREIARKAGIPTAEKKDSQGICFLGKISIQDFLKDYIKEKKGKIITTDGDVVGEHDGVFFYTIGQRHLGTNLRPTTHRKQDGKISEKQKFYVAEKDVKENVLRVAEGSENEALFRNKVELYDISFVDTEMLNPPAGRAGVKSEMKILARVRYRQPLVKAKLQLTTNAEQGTLIFEKPVKFVASGQSAVFYSSDEGDLPAGRQVIGGGVIK